MDQYAATMPLSARSPGSGSLGTTGASLISGFPDRPATQPLTSRSLHNESKSPDLLALESTFFDDTEKERVRDTRHKYPRFKGANTATSRSTEFNGLEEEQLVPRRIMGFSLGFEKIFATTSIKLPVSAYTIYVEMHLSYKDEVFSRCFNGLHTVFDLKKWIFEKLLLPMNAYDLSYAEAGKAMLTEQLRLLTTQDSLDTRTLATTRAVHRMYKGLPGVHSINDVGVTRLYVRLKCRLCGALLNSLTGKYKKFGEDEPQPDHDIVTTGMTGKGKGKGKPKDQNSRGDILRRMTLEAAANFSTEPPRGIPGLDPTLEDCWYEPEWRKGCLFHTRGLELYEASRAWGGASEIARIYISGDKEPSKKLKVAENVLKTKGPCAKVSY